MRISTTTALLVSAALAASALFGCAPAGSEPESSAQQPATAQPPAQQAMPLPDESVDTSAIESMDAQKKRMALTAFPVEVPIPNGTFSRAVTQGGDVWDYELQVPAAPDAVVRWYIERFTGKEWQVVDGGGNNNGGYYVVLRKNAAEARFDVSPSEMPGYSSVTAVVGLGAPVTQVQ